MPKPRSTIQFHAADVDIPVQERRKLKEFIKKQFKESANPLNSLDYIFCSDKYLLDINIRFLQHDTLTDIITFPLQAKGEPVTGEVYISVDRVQDNAKDLGVPLQKELLRVVFHGALHLLGYKDKTKSQSTEMRRLEEDWLEQFKLFHVER
ncbi:MAG TPA: rRNA maturation RNase YbeY [Flavitalea sp.]|nr:rRNA maturation RNase YbeY [Flavitalea sp.]